MADDSHEIAEQMNRRRGDTTRIRGALTIAYRIPPRATIYNGCKSITAWPIDISIASMKQ